MMIEKDTGEVFFKKHLLYVWCFVYDAIYEMFIFLKITIDKCYIVFCKPPVVMDVESSISYIVENKCSVARYGDGEMKLIMGKDISFQKCHLDLQERLKDILRGKDSNLIVCIPGVFGSLSIYNDHDRKYWREYLSRNRKMWYKCIDKQRFYYDAFVSRCYLPYRDKSNADKYFQLWKKLWKGKDVLIVEGAKTRFGIGNDLLDDAHSIKRILGPVKDAYSCYDALFQEVKKAPKDVLVLLALGPTATVLAADLNREGYHAIDIGHLDIEYEWFLKQVDRKVPIEGKYVNEAGAGAGVGECDDEKYKSEIIKVVC